MALKEAPEAAAWRNRGIVAVRKQVHLVSAMYGHHFPAFRVSIIRDRTLPRTDKH
jgi:hypothetical protein